MQRKLFSSGNTPRAALSSRTAAGGTAARGDAATRGPPWIGVEMAGASPFGRRLAAHPQSGGCGGRGAPQSGAWSIGSDACSRPERSPRWRMAPPSRCGCALCRQRAVHPGTCLRRAIARRAVTGWRASPRTTPNPPGMAAGGPSRQRAKQAPACLLRLRSSLAGLRASTSRARSVRGGLRSPRNSPPCARQPEAGPPRLQSALTRLASAGNPRAQYFSHHVNGTRYAVGVLSGACDARPFLPT